MDDNFKSAAPLCIFGIRFVFGFGLLEDAGNLITNSSGLQPTAVGQRRIVRSRGRKVPFLVGGIEAVAVPDDKDVGRRTAHDEVINRSKGGNLQKYKLRTKAVLQKRDVLGKKRMREE